MKKNGFTLVELTITMAIMVVISALGMVALRSATSSVNTAKAKAEVQDNVRDVLAAMKREISLASKTSDNSLNPPLVGLAITQNPVAGSPVQVTFQVPVNGTGKNWSKPITYRFINEDTNNDARLSAGEDKNGNHALSRCIMRIEDLNGNGSTADAGEQKVIGGANDISNATFTLTKNILTISLTANKLMTSRRDHPVTTSVSTNVYLHN